MRYKNDNCCRLYYCNKNPHVGNIALQKFWHLYIILLQIEFQWKWVNVCIFFIPVIVVCLFIYLFIYLLLDIVSGEKIQIKRSSIASYPCGRLDKTRSARRYASSEYIPSNVMLDVCTLVESSAGLGPVWDRVRSVDADVKPDGDSGSSTSDIAATTMPVQRSERKLWKLSLQVAPQKSCRFGFRD